MAIRTNKGIKKNRSIPAINASPERRARGSIRRGWERSRVAARCSGTPVTEVVLTTPASIGVAVIIPTPRTTRSATPPDMHGPHLKRGPRVTRRKPDDPWCVLVRTQTPRSGTDPPRVRRLHARSLSAMPQDLLKVTSITQRGLPNSPLVSYCGPAPLLDKGFRSSEPFPTTANQGRDGLLRSCYRRHGE